MKKLSFICFIAVCTILSVLSALVNIFVYMNYTANQLAQAVTKLEQQSDPNNKLIALQDNVIYKTLTQDAEIKDFTDAQVLAWAEKAVVETMSIGHSFYKDQLENSSRHFTTEGWNSFSNALTQSRILDAIEMNQQDIVSEVGNFAKSDVQLKNKEWIVRIPLHMSYQSHNKTRGQKVIVNATVIQSFEPQNNKTGLGIKQWIATPYSE